MQSRLQEQHNEIMEMELQKAKLHSQIEQLEAQRNELSSTLSDLRRCIMVDKGDYKLLEVERINIIEKLDEQLIELKLEIEEKQKTSNGLTATSNNFRRLIEQSEKRKEKLTKEIILLQNDKHQQTEILNNLKIQTQKEETERREVIVNLQKQIDEMQNKLNEISSNYEEKRFNILKESRQLTIRRADLEIYEMRLRKKYPNETLILNLNAVTS